MVKQVRMVIALMALAACATAAAQAPLRVGSVTDARFQDDWTLDGNQMANTRAKLLNGANFGPGGIASRPIQITDTAGAVGSVDAALLANFDAFFIGYLDDPNANAFTASELSAMQTWVNGGGTMIVTCDESNYDAVCSQFGHPATSGSPGINPIVPTAAGAAHPIFTNVFGTVTSIVETGTKGAFTSTTGATVLAQDSTPGTPLPVVMIQTFGAGRVIFLADVDLIANSLSAGSGISNQNDRFLGNLFAYVGGISGAPAPVITAPIPALSPGMLVLLALGLAAMALVTFRHRRG
jgi:hypothetical protein